MIFQAGHKKEGEQQEGKQKTGIFVHQERRGDEVEPPLVPSRLTPAAAGTIYLFQFHCARRNILKRGTHFSKKGTKRDPFLSKKKNQEGTQF